MAAAAHRTIACSMFITRVKLLSRVINIDRLWSSGRGSRHLVLTAPWASRSSRDCITIFINRLWVVRESGQRCSEAANHIIIVTVGHWTLCLRTTAATASLVGQSASHIAYAVVEFGDERL